MAVPGPPYGRQRANPVLASGPRCESQIDSRDGGAVGERAAATPCGRRGSSPSARSSRRGDRVRRHDHPRADIDAPPAVVTSVVPVTRLTSPATADAVFTALNAAGLRLTPSNAGGKGKGGLVKRIVATYADWPLSSASTAR